MKITLLILFIGACNALPAPQLPDFDGMNRQIQQQTADINRQIQQQTADLNRQIQEQTAALNRGIQEQKADMDRQIQEQMSLVDQQVAEAHKQAADAVEMARKLGLQGNSLVVTNNEDYTIVSVQQSIQNGVRTCSGTRISKVTGQWESFTC